ncbi:cutinase family protein [Nocardia sp. NBC_01503]|uniref:cutinase family protein n=1 Tax=Nocardia sp. NBC_01503 TaxID=2975997 RepID=UPI002E7B565D|nr:cutinase family protein [Nocardia sp. NBC_01503]WTL30106.1 cutinase family protein [Nocardia sp. NBC_01503]
MVRKLLLIITTAGLFTAVTIGGAGAGPPDTNLALDSCPALFALGVQGTGESSPDAAVTTDTGMLSTVFRPMMSEASDNGLVDRAYVPYESSFGGAVISDKTTYSQSVTNGLDRLRSMAKQVADRCSNTRIAVAGYSQGAHVASLFAQEVAAGKGVVPADKVAAVALFGDPTRSAGAAMFPGKPGQKEPDAAPGTSGTEVAKLPPPPQSDQPPAGSGMGTAANIGNVSNISSTITGGTTTGGSAAINFGSLSGRVASFCADGDLACDAPDNAPLLKAVANIAGQVEISGGDPIASLKSIAEALAFTSIKTFTNVVNNDISGKSITDLSIQPQKSLSQRVADAADPNTALNLPAAMQALVKVGTIAFNSVVAVVKNVLTATNIAEIAAAGLANPIAGLALLGTKLVGAVADLVPPTTISNLTTQAFSALVQNVTDNKDLLDVTTWVRYWNTAAKHDYTHAQGGGFGDSPTQFVGTWFAALAHDLSSVSKPGAVPVGGSDKPTGGFDFAPSSTVTTSSIPGGQFPLGGGDSGGGTTATGSAPLIAIAPGTSTAPTTSGAPLIPNLQPQATR